MTVIYKCIDCGKERTGKKSSFKKPREEYRCQDCSNKKKASDPIWILNNKLGGIKRKNNPVWKENQKRGALKKYEDPIYMANRIQSIQSLPNNPIWRKNFEDGIKMRSQNPEWRINLSQSLRDFHNDPSNKDFAKNRSLKRMNTTEGKEFLKFIKTLNKSKVENPIYRERLLISLTGEGFWYGHKILHTDRKHYCELWNDDLKRRIDAAYDYKSILSGKTRFNNNGRALTRHHLYWQEKACCVWDEDSNGYYAWIINNGERVKYYINGDPNKFVLLTDKEHGIVKGKKGTSKDRIYYIKLMEGLIEQREKEGKKCYLTPEEYEIYKVEHADIIAKYKK